ncbi:heme peroxidase [Artemisia annua]|uniref:Peroxidase n=1 Tax=Artemisia annua TaxID=35608 RepID=A0A2U1P9W3_ARTAN|nr:heme peroxidase [Artemisia annua]
MEAFKGDILIFTTINLETLLTSQYLSHLSFFVYLLESNMAIQKQLIVVLQLLLIALVLKIANGKGLELGFYKNTCPRVEAIVRKTTANYIHRAPSLAAGLLRMHFHDCFVRGCDGSVLLNSTTNNQAEKEGIPNLTLRGFQVIDAAKTALEAACPGVVSCADILALAARDAIYQGCDGSVLLNSTANNQAEKEGIPNLTLRGFQVIDAAKTALEAACPGVVSCADILALAARDAIYQIKGPFWPVPLGRRDGHTVGVSHCPVIVNRLYNFTGKGDTDPSLDPKFIPQLKSICSPTDTTTVLAMDRTPRSFDEDYYTVVLRKRGLFQSDAALLNDKQTSAYVKLQSKSFGYTFFNDFSKSMVKMGKIGVLTGFAGEIRRTCALVN